MRWERKDDTPCPDPERVRRPRHRRRPSPAGSGKVPRPMRHPPGCPRGPHHPTRQSLPARMHSSSPAAPSTGAIGRTGSKRRASCEEAAGVLAEKSQVATTHCAVRPSPSGEHANLPDKRLNEAERGGACSAGTDGRPHRGRAPLSWERPGSDRLGRPWKVFRPQGQPSRGILAGLHRAGR